nr:MFS transporter [Corynebacterium sp. TAE3-ERU16]
MVVWATTVGAVTGLNLFEPSGMSGWSLALAPHSGAHVITISARLFVVSVLQVALRPDPALIHSGAGTQRPQPEDEPPASRVSGPGSVSVVVTAVHMHEHGVALTLIGVTISLHVAGMHALAPLLGFTADRFGRLPTVVAGYAMITGCCVLLIIGDGETVMVVIALTLLWLGWSAALVGSSALLVDVVPAGMRVRAQGRSDLTMNVAAAFGGAVSGPAAAMSGMPVWEGGGARDRRRIPRVVRCVGASRRSLTPVRRTGCISRVFGSRMTDRMVGDETSTRKCDTYHMCSTGRPHPGLRWAEKM